MVYKSADNLNSHKERGSKLTHDEWNAVARAVGADKIAPHSHGDESTFALARKSQDRRWFPVSCPHYVVPPYSALCLWGARGSVGGAGQDEAFPAYPVVRLFEIGTTGNLQHTKSSVIVTNGARAFDPATDGGGFFLLDVHVVDDVPCLLRVATGAGGPYTNLRPPANSHAGFHFQSGSAATGQVCLGKSGLLSVSHPFQSADLPDPSAWYQWFVASRGPIAVFGRVEGSAITAANKASSTLGQGAIRVYGRADNGFTFDAGGLDNFNNRVWNIEEFVIPVGTYVVAIDVPTVGLVVTTTAQGETCTTIGPFVTSVGPPVVTKNIKLCVNWGSKSFTFEQV